MSEPSAAALAGVRYDVDRRHGDVGVTAWTRQNRRIGELVAHFIGGGPGGAPRFALSYVGVATDWQGKGVGEDMLRLLHEKMPEGVDTLHVMQVTSKGVRRLIERVFGPLTLADGFRDHTAERLPERMDHDTLRTSRGPNFTVTVERQRAAA